MNTHERMCVLHTGHIDDKAQQLLWKSIYPLIKGTLKENLHYAIVAVVYEHKHEEESITKYLSAKEFSFHACLRLGMCK